MSEKAKAPVRFTSIPPWLETRTGIAAIVIGSLIVAVKTLELTGSFGAGWLKTAYSSIFLAALIVAFVNTWIAFRNRKATPEQRLPWRSFAVGLAVMGFAAAAHSIIESFTHRWDLQLHRGLLILTLVSMLIIARGILKFPAAPLPKGRRAPAALDFLTMILATFLALWIYAVYPAVDNLSNDWIPFALVSAHTAASLLMIGAVLLILFRPHPAVSAKTLNPIAAGVAILILTEVVPASAAINSTGEQIEPTFVGWPLFALALAIAAQSYNRNLNANNPPDSSTIYFTVPFATTALVGFLLFTTLFSPELWDAHASVMLPATFVALVLIVLRQSLIARENLLMADEMAKAKEIAETANNSRLQFLANISHDLRTPLNGVLGCSQILLREKTFDRKQRGLLKTMQGCAEHLRNLINDLLDLSKLEADRLELAPDPCDLQGFLDSLIRTFTLEAQDKDITLRLESHPDVPAWIRCDRKRLQQILGNLIHNSIKFTDLGGVWLRTRVEGPDILFEIQDTGCGIHPDAMKDLFQPFHVVDEKSIKLEGTGLGLSISRKLAQKMNGDIDVQSTLGKGTKFTLHFPLVEAEPQVEVQRTVVDYQGRRRRVLIVDDRPANRVVLRSLLEPIDFFVDEAGNAEETFKILEHSVPDLILMDLMMPGMDGFELCKKVGEMKLARQIPCVAISAMSGDEVEERCRNAGFVQLLNKPVNLDMLLNALQRHAGVEWTYGVLQPSPEEEGKQLALGDSAPIVPPPQKELAEFINLARRGVVRAIENRAEQLAQDSPQYAAFAKRVTIFTSAFKIKELTEWLGSLTRELANGPK